MPSTPTSSESSHHLYSETTQSAVTESHIPFTITVPQRFTTTTVTYTYTNPVTSTGFGKSPLDDPRIGWIHILRKADLSSEMAKHGLSTDGTVEVLRKRFGDYWEKIPIF